MITDGQRAKLGSVIQEAAILRDWCNHVGYKIWKKCLDDRLSDLKNEWLKSDDAQGQKIKLRAQVYNEVLEVLAKKILEGEAAALSLKTADVESDPDING